MMSDRGMNVPVNVSQEEAFRSVTDYFAEDYMKFGRMARIVTSESPSYIRAEIGSWSPMLLGNPRGEAEVTIVGKDDKTYVSLRLGFRKEYAKTLIQALTVTIFICIYLLWYSLANPPGSASTTTGVILTTALLVVFVFGLEAGISAINISLTRSKLTREFNMFMQSLPIKKMSE
jgi:hypothetical protein